jgi:hypothetical protein
MVDTNIVRTEDDYLVAFRQEISPYELRALARKLYDGMMEADKTHPKVIELFFRYMMGDPSRAPERVRQDNVQLVIDGILSQVERKQIAVRATLEQVEKAADT